MDVTSVIRIEKIYSDKDIIDNYFEIKPEDLLEMGVKNSNAGIEELQELNTHMEYSTGDL